MQGIIGLSMVAAPVQAFPATAPDAPILFDTSQDHDFILNSQRSQFIELYQKAILSVNPEVGDVLELQEFMGFTGSNLDDKRGPITIGAAQLKAADLGLSIIETSPIDNNGAYRASNLSTPTKVHGVDANRLFFILMGVESGRKQFGGPLSVKGSNEPTTSYAGCVGIAQINPKYAQRFSAQFGMEWSEDKLNNDAAYNAEMGFNFLVYLLKLYKGNAQKAVAAYNAGETAVNRAGGVPNNGETPRYVEKILGQYNAGAETQWASQLPEILSPQNAGITRSTKVVVIDTQNSSANLSLFRSTPIDRFNSSAFTASFRRVSAVENTANQNTFSLGVDAPKYRNAFETPVLKIF